MPKPTIRDKTRNFSEGSRLVPAIGGPGVAIEPAPVWRVGAEESLP